jgi:hypothetical protein
LTVQGLIPRNEAISRLVFDWETSVKTRSSAAVNRDSSFDRLPTQIASRHESIPYDKTARECHSVYVINSILVSPYGRRLIRCRSS